eukprot:Skav210564  [mRNA]  locus=scaffold2317:150940:153419:+ [translate_table: standard]
MQPVLMQPAAPAERIWQRGCAHVVRGQSEARLSKSLRSCSRPLLAGAASSLGALSLRRELRRLRLHRAARGGDPKAPPEPRARGPRSERDVANDVVFGVVAVDLLFNHDRLDEEVGEAFRRSVYDPAWKRLRLGRLNICPLGAIKFIEMPWFTHGGLVVV